MFGKTNKPLKKLDPSGNAALQKPWKNSLEDLYVKSFPNLLSTEEKLQLTVYVPPDGDKTFEVRFRLHQDFDSHTDFVSLFVPVFHDARLDDMLPQILFSFADEVKAKRDELRSSVGTGISSPGTAYIEGKDLVFSGRIFIYTQNNLTPIQIGELTKQYAEKGMFLEIRGSDYFWFHKDDQ